jgi:hypothetical protein
MEENMQMEFVESHKPILNMNKNPQMHHFSGYFYGYISLIIFVNILTLT